MVTRKKETIEHHIPFERETKLNMIHSKYDHVFKIRPKMKK